MLIYRFYQKPWKKPQDAQSGRYDLFAMLFQLSHSNYEKLQKILKRKKKSLQHGRVQFVIVKSSGHQSISSKK